MNFRGTQTPDHTIMSTRIKGCTFKSSPSPTKLLQFNVFQCVLVASTSGWGGKQQFEELM